MITNHVVLGMDPIMYELHKIPKSGMMGTKGHANVVGGGDRGSTKSMPALMSRGKNSIIMIHACQEFDSPTDVRIAEAVKTTTSHTGLAPLSWTL